MNNGVVFNSEGPMMSGTWYNPNTGDSFTVLDNFFENNQFMVTTTDGRMLNYDQIQYYIQSDKPINQPAPSPLSDVPASITSMLEDNSGQILSDDMSLIHSNLNTIGTPEVGKLYVDPEWSNPSVSISNNYPIIEKALSKTVLPEIDVQLKWSKYPEREIEMLTDIMDVQMSEIVDWYINKFGVNEIKKLIENSIESYFYIKEDNPEEVAATNQVIKKTKSKKK